MRAVGYIRVSTEDQALGPDAQRSAIEAWALRTGAEIVSWREDLGVSGGADIDKRIGLLDAIGDLGEFKATVLVVAKRDRLARDVPKAAAIEHLCKKAGATVHSAGGEPVDDTPEAQLMRRILDAFAEYELGLIRARTRAALRVKQRRGERTGSVPYGKRLARDGVRLEVCESEASAVATARRLRSEGLTLGQVAALMVVEGHRPRRGRCWHTEQIRRMCAQS